VNLPPQSSFIKVVKEASGILRAPQRVPRLLQKFVADGFRASFESRHLYSYTGTERESLKTLDSLIHWVADAQRPDGGIAAYYSLLSGYSASYPEVTGYLIPTLHDFAAATGSHSAAAMAARATRWLLALQMPAGAFPSGLQGSELRPSVFNTGQILQGLIRAHIETRRSEILSSAVSAGDWLLDVQQPDGSWSGAATYQNQPHSYYSMVAWSLAQLSEHTRSTQYGLAAEKNLDFVLAGIRPSGWVDGINLRGHPTYLHFIAYALQGALECAILRQRPDAIDRVAHSAWILLRKFETQKFLFGSYQKDFKPGSRSACLTGNAQMSCVWLRLFEITGDLRYLNAALKMNELLKQLVPLRGRSGIRGGVSGSYPIWGRYQPLRYISWGCKFLADSLLLEGRLMRSLESAAPENLPCAS